MNRTRRLDPSEALETADGSSELQLRVEDWRASCVARAPSSAPTLAPLPALLRRRVSAVGQEALQAAWTLQPPPAARFVFCSRHGEFDRTLRLLKALATREELSPADFNLSVANALAGLLAIASKNTAGHTAIAAGDDSFAFGLLEAATCLASRSDEQVLLVYFDDPLPAEYSELADGQQSATVLAALLGQPRGAGDDILLSPISAVDCAKRPRTPSHARDFLCFLTEGKETLSAGRQIGWRYRYACAKY